MSLDEAYLDVTLECQNSSATELAEHIRNEIFDLTKLTASAGVAPNKMIAKIASDINKPNGIAVVKPHFAFQFMQPLLLKKIPFIGPVTFKKFSNHNLMTCANVVASEKNI
ncbi:hypothetical protein AXG55_12560 [Silvanigrella aquatica]|uniref:UmuC domain-containing protein n=1 Tax=Silvanigrella aquatica TaxID=1915309 RepID=A0A1L4D3A9_9BACT|nr:hypothetical protein AXG55_12560 [Silvanigrella aquatica]